MPHDNADHHFDQQQEFNKIKMHGLMAPEEQHSVDFNFLPLTSGENNSVSTMNDGPSQQGDEGKDEDTLLTVGALFIL
jgi:hypothetical protein